MIHLSKPTKSMGIVFSKTVSDGQKKMTIQISDETCAYYQSHTKRATTGDCGSYCTPVVY
jgi:hypothetical protein